MVAASDSILKYTGIFREFCLSDEITLYIEPAGGIYGCGWWYIWVWLMK